MGTHPIFESDFDCLTERIGSKMIHNPKQIEFAENLIIKLFPDQFTRPLPNIDRQTVEYLCNNYQNLKFRRILKAVELAWTENLVPGSYFKANTRPVVQNVSQPSPIGRLVQPNKAPSSPNPFVPSTQNIGTQAIQINITPNGKTPRAKRTAPALGPQTCSALFKKRKEQIENSSKRNTDPDSFLIPHQTPHQLTKTQKGPTTSNAQVLNNKVTNSLRNGNDKPLSMASLPPDLRQNLEKTLNSHLNNSAPKISPPNEASTNDSLAKDDILTIDVSKPGPSGLQSTKPAEKPSTSSAFVDKTSTELQTPISKPSPMLAIVSKPTDSLKSPTITVNAISPKAPSPTDIMDTIAGGKRMTLDVNMPSNMDDIRRALRETKHKSSDAESKTPKVTEPDRTVIDKIIGARSKSDKSKIDSDLQNILNDVNGKIERCASTDSSSTDSGNETVENPGSSSLPSPKNSTRDQNKGTKQKKVPAETEKIARSGIEILSSIEVLDSDEEAEVQKNRENVKRNIREILAETDGVVTIDDSDDEHSSNEENNKNPKSKNNNHKSNSNHLDDLLDIDHENGENDTDEEEEAESELEPVKKVPRTKRNEPRSFVKSGYDLVKSRSRKKSTDVVSRRELPTKKKQKPSTKIIPEVIIPPPAVEHPPTPPEVCQDEKGNFIVKKVLKTRRTKENGIEYKCRYVGFTKDDDEWVTFDAMEGTEKQKKKLIAEYEKRKSKKN